MRKGFLVLAAACSAAMALAPTSSAEMVVPADSSTGQANNSAPVTSYGAITGWNNVGETNNYASATYIGNGWVLTAAHVGAVPVSFDGGATYYDPDYTESQLTNTDSSTSDLLLFHLSSTPSLPDINLATSEPTLGTTTYSTGFGLSRDAYGPLYYDVELTSSTTATWTQTIQSHANETLYIADINIGTKLWGSNVISQTTTEEPTSTAGVYIDGFNTTFNTPGTGSPSGVTGQSLVTGDSGGGVFNSQGQLIGINDELLYIPAPDQPNYSSPGVLDTAAYGDVSAYSDIYSYLSQIESITGVPEPSALLLPIVTAGLMMFRRPRRRRLFAPPPPRVA